MTASELIQFICNRNSALCDFIDDLREVGFGYEYRAKLLKSTDSYLDAAQVIYDNVYGK